jgi:hypothetical protein
MNQIPLCKRAGSKHPDKLADYLYLQYPLVTDLLDTLPRNRRILDVSITHHAIDTNTYNHEVYIYYDVCGMPYYTHHMMTLGLHTSCAIAYSVGDALRPVSDTAVCERLLPLCVKNQFAILADASSSEASEE